MANGRLLSNDLAQGSGVSISVYSEESTFEKEFAFNNVVQDKYRSEGISTSEYILINLGSAQKVEEIALYGLDILAGDTFTISAGTDSSCADYGPIALDKDTKSLKTIGETYQYWKIKFSGSTGTYREFGQICLYGRSSTFAKNWIWGYQSGIEVKKSLLEGDAGQRHSETKFSRKRGTYEFDLLDDTQRDLFDETIRLDGEFVTFYDNVKDEFHFGQISFDLPQNKFSDNSKMFMEFIEAK